MNSYFIFLKDLFLYIYKPVLLSILVTYVSVVSHFDWNYFLFVTKYMPKYFLFSADVLGFIIPIFLPLVLFLYYKIKKDIIYRKLSMASLIAVIISYTFSTVLKVITNRESPPMHYRDGSAIFLDNSNNFDFGFMNSSFVGGWPSSHATIMFSIAFLFIHLYAKNKKIKIISFLLATYISVGVSFGFHWFSELISGALLGASIGKFVFSKYKII